MALFDLFGLSQPSYMTDLLDTEKLRLLKEQAGRQALMQAGLSALSQSGYSKVPVSLGEILGKAGTAGLESYQGAMQQGAQDALLSQKLAEAKLAREKQAKQQRFFESIGLPNVTRQVPVPQPAYEPMPTGTTAPNFNVQPTTPQFRTEEYFDPNQLIMDALRSGNLDFKDYLTLMAKDKQDTKVVGRSLVDPTGRVIYREPQEQEEWTDTESLGGQLVQRNKKTGQIRQAVTAPASTNIHLPPQEKTVLEVDQETLKSLSNAANSSRSIANNMQSLDYLMGDMAGSGSIKLSANLQGFLGIPSKEAKINDVVRGIVNKAATEIRTPGATSDMEFNAYREAFPSLANSRDGRKIMVKVAKASAERNAKLADWARNAVIKGTFSQEGLNAYDASLGRAVGLEIENKVKELTKSTSGSIDPNIDRATKIIKGEYNGLR